MPDDKDLIPNEETTNMTESGPNTPTEVASGKALHDINVANSLDNDTEEATEDDFVKFDLDSVDDE